MEKAEGGVYVQDTPTPCPHGGLQTSFEGQLAQRELTFRPFLLQVWSRTTRLSLIKKIEETWRLGRGERGGHGLLQHALLGSVARVARFRSANIDHFSTNTSD